MQVVSPTKLNVLGMVNNEQVYRGIRDCLSKTYKEGGVRGLYRGVGMCLKICLCLELVIKYCISQLC
jgi:solute carrier family 25 protein 16